MFPHLQNITIIQNPATNPFAVMRNAVGAVQVFNDAAVLGTDDLSVMTADVVAVDLQVIFRSAANKEATLLQFEITQ